MQCIIGGLMSCEKRQTLQLDPHSEREKGTTRLEVKKEGEK